MKSKQKKSQSQFIEMVEDIRQELTERVSDISSAGDFNSETVKLLKEMTSIIKELDRLIKDSKNDGTGSDEQRIDFLRSLKDKALIDDENE